MLVDERNALCNKRECHRRRLILFQRIQASSGVRELENAFDKPLSVVITDELAEKIYGSTDVVGKTLTFDVFGGGKKKYVITAVRKTIVRNSITNFGGDEYDLIVPFNSTGDFINAKAGPS